VARSSELGRHLLQQTGAALTPFLVCVAIWVLSGANGSSWPNAGGWPSDGFSQSSGSPRVWNIWIIYPVLSLGLALVIDAWNTYGRRKISESEIRREIDRLAGRYGWPRLSGETFATVRATDADSAKEQADERDLSETAGEVLRLRASCYQGLAGWARTTSSFTGSL
jgi:hypothetical protein